ncbi:hypothetical protein NEOC65_001813 [Neochlamydia sp. AcF65]|nr:hypothetical protein [Neochlamydia sp. AcF65]MBS4171489.1 hypothetical protein [Neochlamydia sp. AcF95]
MQARAFAKPPRREQKLKQGQRQALHERIKECFKSYSRLLRKR